MLPPFVPIPFEQGAIFINEKQEPTPVFTGGWPRAWNSSRDLIVYVEDQIVCAQLEGEELMAEYRVPIPDSFEALCVSFAFGHIFVGGKGGAQKIFSIRIHDFQAVEVEHPNILKKYRKSIDDFFVWDEKVYAVDNHIHPKYLLGYRLEDRMWKCVDRIKLKGHSPEERVKRGVLWGDTLVLLSRSAHRAGSTTYLSLYPNLVFDRYLCWHKTIGSSGITDIVGIRLVQDDLLLITNAGVYVLQKGGKESDVRCVSSQKYLVDVYPYIDQSWVGIVSKFGKKKKVLIPRE